MQSIPKGISLKRHTSAAGTCLIKLGLTQIQFILFTFTPLQRLHLIGETFLNFNITLVLIKSPLYSFDTHQILTKGNVLMINHILATLHILVKLRRIMRMAAAVPPAFPPLPLLRSLSEPSLPANPSQQPAASRLVSWRQHKRGLDAHMWPWWLPWWTAAPVLLSEPHSGCWQEPGQCRQ